MTRNPVYAFFQTPGSTAPLFLRLTLAVLFFYHGAQKSFGWFDGDGLSATLALMTKSGHFGLSAFLAATAIVAELLVVPLLLFGFLTRIAALFVMILMAGALYFVYGGSPFPEIQLPLLVLATGISLLLSGGGRFSLDRSICRTLLPEVGTSGGYRPLSF